MLSFIDLQNLGLVPLLGIFFSIAVCRFKFRMKSFLHNLPGALMFSGLLVGMYDLIMMMQIQQAQTDSWEESLAKVLLAPFYGLIFASITYIYTHQELWTKKSPS